MIEDVIQDSNYLCSLNHRKIAVMYFIQSVEGNEDLDIIFSQIWTLYFHGHRHYIFTDLDMTISLIWTSYFHALGHQFFTDLDTIFSLIWT